MYLSRSHPCPGHRRPALGPQEPPTYSTASTQPPPVHCAPCNQRACPKSRHVTMFKTLAGLPLSSGSSQPLCRGPVPSGPFSDYPPAPSLHPRTPACLQHPEITAFRPAARIPCSPHRPGSPSCFLAPSPEKLPCPA